MPAMTRKAFATVTRRDFDNLAVRDEIDLALKQREQLLAAIKDLVAVIDEDELIPHTLSYMREALNAIAEAERA